MDTTEPLSAQELGDESYTLLNEASLKGVEAHQRQGLEDQFAWLRDKLEQTHLELGRSLQEKDRLSNYLNNILASLSSGVLVVDLEGRVILFNRAAEAITGRRQEAVLGASYAAVMGMEAGREKTVLHTLDTGRSLVNREKEMRGPNGVAVPLGFSTGLVRDEEGGAQGAVEVFTDLTEVKMLEAEVQRVHTLAALGEMAATVAHEIRNPLGGIAGFATLLERDLDGQDPKRQLVRKISQGVARLDRIVSSLLTYTRPLAIEARPLPLEGVVEEVASLFAADNAPEGIELRRRYADQETVCRIDPDQLQQVVMNLLRNARQAMPSGGTVEIVTGREGGLAVIEVGDTGVGMADDLLDKLFTPFFSTKEEGTGLGLIISKKIVEAHGGRIRVTSQVGAGTCFRVELPLSARLAK
ncbi:MAG: PAS domain S-box protein [Candidatus Latescibacteria bacterium]|nr:PAS domain S-box protein [Candidatus Latescibacterota bacterium]